MRSGNLLQLASKLSSAIAKEIRLVSALPNNKPGIARAKAAMGL
jgi:hypothetical protein